MDSKLLRIGDFAKLAGTNLRTLRYYEEVGLFQPMERSQGGFRYYRETDVHRLNLIRSLQELGLSLEAIRDLLDTRAPELPRHELLAHVEEALAAQDALLADRIRTIEEQRGRIAEARLKLGECRPCGRAPHPDNNYCEPCPVTRSPLPEQLSALF
jgi:DNA-binding transcriptional MerR regulator